MLSPATKKPDNVLLSIVSILLLFGLVMIASAGIVYSQARFTDQYFFFKHQLLFGVFPGVLVLYLMQRIDYHYWRKIATPLFIVSLICLILVFIPGIGSKIYGASRWIKLGFLSFQPSEIAKLATIIYLAAWMESKGSKKIKDFFEGFLPFLGIMGLVGFLIIKQPDVGTFGIISLIALAIYFMAGARISHILLMLLAGIALFFILIKTAPYRLDRFLVFLNPELDPQGVGYQINQALLAVGSGGVFGTGLGHSRQKFNYLPEPVGDSIFAIISEELGLVGAGILVILFLALAFRGFKIAKNVPDFFGRIIATGVTSWVIFQAFMNIAAILGLVPLTGIPLPFISYGGTSLVFLLAGIGILLNISKQTKLKA